MTESGVPLNACGSDRDPGDTAWILSSAILVLTMQGGFALLESGCVRVNNSVNILVKNVFDFALGSIAFWALGWGFYKGDSLGGFIGTSNFFPDANLDYADFFFQLSFAATAATIDSGACAERMDMMVYFGLSFFLTCFTYPVVAHWVWHEDGWLNQLGYRDLAGVSVVHVVGGASALVCAKFLGPRLGVLDTPIPEKLKCVEDQLRLSHEVFEGHPIHVLFGAFLLFFGWLGFNAGSSLAVSGTSHIEASHIAFITVLGAAFGAVSGTIVASKTTEKGHMKPADIATALLAGLVAVTGGANVFRSYGGIILACIASPIAILTTKTLPRVGIDDPVGVLPVHLFAGLIGTIGVGLFATSTACTGVIVDEGLFYSGSFRLFGVQLLGALVIFLWSACMTALFLFFVKYVLRREIRVDPIHEMVGNDVMEHGVDLFRRLKHTHRMQKMMAKLNAKDASSLNNSAISEAHSIKSQFESQGNNSKIFPTSKAPHERKRALRRKEHARSSTVLSLAGNNNFEALTFASSNIEQHFERQKSVTLQADSEYDMKSQVAGTYFEEDDKQ